MHFPDLYICVVSVAALKRKKGLEKELEKLQGVKVQLEMNMNTLESTGVNQETMVAMKKTVDTLKHVYGDLYVPSPILSGCIRSHMDV